MQLKDVPRIRTRRDPNEVGQVLQAHTRRKKFCNDHIFEDLGRASRFGVYWSRTTQRSASNAEKLYRTHLAAHGIRPDGEQIGDWDGILYWTSADPGAIPEWFKKHPGRVKRGRLQFTPSPGGTSTPKHASGGHGAILEPRRGPGDQMTTIKEILDALAIKATQASKKYQERRRAVKPLIVLKDGQPYRQEMRLVVAHGWDWERKYYGRHRVLLWDYDRDWDDHPGYFWFASPKLVRAVKPGMLLIGEWLWKRTRTEKRVYVSAPYGLIMGWMVDWGGSKGELQHPEKWLRVEYPSPGLLSMERATGRHREMAARDRAARAQWAEKARNSKREKGLGVKNTESHKS